MTDDERRTDIDQSLQQWIRAMVAKGHPAGLVKERIAVVRGLGFDADAVERMAEMRKAGL